MTKEKHPIRTGPAMSYIAVLFRADCTTTIEYTKIDKYLTRHIYMDHNSGDRNCGSTKIWGFFSEIPKFRTPN